jgi:hypothetical protein
MNIFLRVLGATAFILLATSPLVLAERSLTAEMERSVEQYQVRKNKQNLTGWNGILFFCQFDDDSNQAVKDICEKTYVNAEFLAATAKINLIKGRDGFQMGFEAGVGELLVLEVKLNSTERPSAVHANVRAYVGYYNAVQTHPGDKEKKDARIIPRSGDLIFWERSVLGASSGTAQDLAIPLSQGIEQPLKEFFADYLKAQR